MKQLKKFLHNLRLDGSINFSLILNGLSLLLLFSYFIFFVYHFFKGILFPFELQYQEALLFEVSKMASLGEPIYLPVGAGPPYILCQYTPLYMWVVGKLMPLVGTSYAFGRLLAFLSAITIGLIIFLILRRETKNIFSSLVASLFFFGLTCVNQLAGLFRMGFSAVALVFIGIYLVYRWRGNWSIYLSIVFFVMAVYTKQPMIAFLPGVFLYIFLKDKKMAMIFGSVSALLIVGIALIYNHFNPAFISDVLANGLYQYDDIAGSLKDIYYFVLLHSILLVLALVVFFHKETRSQSRLFIILSIFILVIVIRGRIMVGATDNHYLPFMALVCVLFGFVFDFARKSTLNNTNSFLSVLISLLVLFQLVILFHAPFLPERFNRQSFPKVPSIKETRVERKPILDMINNAKGKVLSIDGTFTIDAGKEMDVGPDGVYEFLGKRGIWDTDEFRNKLRNQEYDLIVSDVYALKSIGGPDIDKYYELAFSTKVHTYWVWKPRGKLNEK